MSDGGITEINDQAWRASAWVEDYTIRDLMPAEVILLVRYSAQLAGRVLDLGCGAGRLVGYLAELAGEPHGLDISEEMLGRCRSLYPEVPLTLGSFTDPSSWPPGQFDQIWMVNNLIDVIDHERRGRFLDEARGRLAPGGVLIFSSHNLDSVGHEHRLGWVRRVAWTPPMVQLRHLLRAGRRRRNRRRMEPLASGGDGYAILNDALHDHALLLYFIGRDAQEAQLEAHGWRLLECLDGQGRRVERGEISRSQDLNYVAVPAPGPQAASHAT